MPLHTTFNQRYLNGHRKQTCETENSDSDLKSVRPKKEVQKEQLKKMGGFLLQITWMLVYCLALAATGPLLIGLPGDNMFILMTWKLQITLFVYIPLAYIEMRQKNSSELTFKHKYIKKFFYMIFASIMYLIWLMGLLEACKKSYILHALLMNNLGILLMRKQTGVLTKFQIFAILGVCLLLFSSYSGE